MNIVDDRQISLHESHVIAQLYDFLKSESQWKNIFWELTKSDPILFLQAGVDYYKKCENSTKNLFWKEVLKTLIEFVSEFKTNNIAGTLSTPIWYNPSIKIGNKSIFYKKFYDNGFHIIKDFFNNNGKFLTFEQLVATHHIQIPFTRELKPQYFSHGLYSGILTQMTVSCCLTNQIL